MVKDFIKHNAYHLDVLECLNYHITTDWSMREGLFERSILYNHSKELRLVIYSRTLEGLLGFQGLGSTLNLTLALGMGSH
ncbi:MAG: hypothetical protein CCU26_17260 [Nitrospira sp. UW-LDO-01]|nr:MAG: hypothetical protein CCU26_17260 [Nitrospira sp. UW-LDO-01]